MNKKEPHFYDAVRSLSPMNTKLTIIFKSKCDNFYSFVYSRLFVPSQGRIQNFKLGGRGALKFFGGVFRVKNHDFTPKNHIFFQF